MLSSHLINNTVVVGGQIEGVLGASNDRFKVRDILDSRLTEEPQPNIDVALFGYAFMVSF